MVGGREKLIFDWKQTKLKYLQELLLQESISLLWKSTLGEGHEAYQFQNNFRVVLSINKLLQITQILSRIYAF